MRKNKKILIIGSKEHFTLEMMYYKAFKNETHHIDIFSIEKILNYDFILKLKYIFIFPFFLFQRIKIISFLFLNRKQYDLIVVFKGIYFNPYTINLCKKLTPKSLWINIFTDDPFNFSNSMISNTNVLKSIKFFDYYCLWSKKIISKVIKQLLINKNKLIYLPFAFDDTKKKFIQKFKLPKYNINFIGSYDAIRLDFIKSINIEKFIIGGGYWLKKKNNLYAKVMPHIHGKKLFDITNSSVISLNILRPQNLTSHNMRTFEIPSMNGLMLTTRSNEQNLFFKENKECFMYNGKKELKNKIKYIMNNPVIANKVRAKGFLMSKKHTYKSRVKFLLQYIFKK